MTAQRYYMKKPQVTAPITYGHIRLLTLARRKRRFFLTTDYTDYFSLAESAENAEFFCHTESTEITGLFLTTDCAD